MKPSLKIIIGILAMALIGISLYSYKNKPANVPVAEQPQAEQKKLTKENEAISVNIVYPIIPGNTKGTSDANAEILSDIDKRVADFEKEAIESKVNSLIDLPAEIKSTVTGSPSVEEKNDRYVAIFMGMEWYLRGAAHPGHTIDTYVYDYKKDTLATVPDMFKQESDYLAVLSKLSKEDLLAQSKTGDIGYVYQAEMVEEGTKPTAENFSRMLPLKDGLAIYFNEYQVAPYAAGPQQVVIPYVKLKDIISPDGVLGMYIQ